MRTKTIRLLIVAALLQLAALPVSRSQQINPRFMDQSWTARWISCPGAPDHEFSVQRFRKHFDLRAAPAHFVVHASGDNRYELFVNGKRVVEGPARGDLFHWRFETLDIASQLHAGSNTLAAVVWNFGDRAPMAQMTNQTGFILQGDTDDDVSTGNSWSCALDSSVSMLPPPPALQYTYIVVGPGERVDGSKFPWGWETSGFDDSKWQRAQSIVAGAPRGARDSHSRWMFVPRNIPLMESHLQRMARIVYSKGTTSALPLPVGSGAPGTSSKKEERLRRFMNSIKSQGIMPPNDFLEGHSPFTVAPHTEVTHIADQSFLTTAYPELIVSGGRGAEITLTYAEAPVKEREKGNRNDIDGKTIQGFQDVFLPDGGAHRLFRPLWWRTYRYVQIDVKTQDDPLTLEDFRGQFTAYPFVRRAQFESDDPELSKMWEVGWRTARLCAHETYMDCPYYEQLQYAGDTRIQALISLYMTGDDRLVKNAVQLLDDSRTPDGLTQSRYPSYLPQYIPPFSLLWIGMMHDLWWYRGDADFLRRFLPGQRDVLGWFESRLSHSGLLGKLEW